MAERPRGYGMTADLEAKVIIIAQLPVLSLIVTVVCVCYVI